MKPFRIAVVLMALLVLPLFATQALASFVPTLYDVPNGLVGANTKDKPVIGFVIPSSQNGKHLKTVKVRSYIERVYATERVELWKENGTTGGFQSDEDLLLKGYITSGIEFDINEEISFLNINSNSNSLLNGADTFYITLDINTGVVDGDPLQYYHQTGLEVRLEAGYIKLAEAAGDSSTAPVENPGWLQCPLPAPPPYYCPYTLVFDTQGPQFDLHVCMVDSTCSTYTYYGSGWSRLLNVDQEDSLRICATDVEADIDTAEGIHIIGKVHLLGPVSSLHMFGVDDLMLMCPNDDPWGCGGGGDKQGCDSCWSTGFRIPDAYNEGGFDGVDADSGHWAICAWAEDTVGNRDTICIEHDALPWRIDTQKPKLDSVTWQFTYDGNSDGKIGLGDSIMVIGWGLSNSWEPVFECSKMEVDWSWYTGNPSPDWYELNDKLEHNRIFRRVFGLTNPVAIDSTNCPVNFLARAWDNACNYDTMTAEICGTIDLDPPSVQVLYEWNTDYDTMWACMSLGDKVLIRALVGGSDIVSVTAMMDSAGIDALMRHALPLTKRGSGVWDTIWTITEPPILYGKDADNSTPPPVDNDYRVWVTACDDVGNCVSVLSDTLNKTLDTRRPRPIGFACPDTVPCIHAQSKAGGKIDLYWDKDCDENDAYYYYVWASFEGAPFESIGATNIIEQTDPTFVYWHSEPLEEGYWTFKIKTEDNCSNVGDFSCVVGAFADTTPPHVCIAVPDSGLTFGSWFPLKAVADSESHDVASACLWYRLRPDIENPTQDPGEWKTCINVGEKLCGMYRPDDGIVFTDSVHCLEGVAYIGWVEMIVVACDEVGNCQDTAMAWLDACLVDNDVFRPGHFFFYWDTLAPPLHLVTVNGFPSPQSDCGYDVNPDSMNAVVIDVDGATSADSFEVEVRGLCPGFECRIFHQDFLTMPCTIWVSVDGWPEGTQNIYIYVKNYDNNKTSNLQLELCVPPSAPDHCIYLAWPHEWMRIPCTGTSGYNCVRLTAELYDHYQCQVLFTEARFQWSPNGIDSWETIADVIGGGPTWSTCWDNTGEVKDGDTVYFRVIAHDQYYMADTSYMVKVFVDCKQPQVSLRIEDLFYTCGNETPKVSCDPLTLKAVLEDTLIDIDRIRFFFKRHSVPDIHEYWIPIDGWAQPAWSDNIWMYQWNEPCCKDDVGFGDDKLNGNCMYPNDYWDIRIAAADIAGHYMFDYDEDGFFDDSTFNDAVAFGAGITVFLDKEAPEPAISLVKDVATGIAVVNPSELLGGTGEAYVQAGHDITAEISVLPSEDSCEVMKVHWYLKISNEWVHVGTSFDPYHYPVTFNPVTNGLIPPYELEDGWWEGSLMAELHDSLGNISTDEITLYILDITPTQAIITSPLNESYVWGNVPLRAMALNDYDICKLCYEFKPEGDSVWYPVNGGYPNACVIRQEFGEEPPLAPGIKITSGAGVPSSPGDNCGNPIEVHIPGDLPYHEFGQTTCGRKDDDNDGCLYAWDGAEDIYYKLIVTQCVDLDVMLYPNSTEKTGMAIGSECKLHGNCPFKSTTYGSSPHGWTDIHLEPGTYYLQIDGRWDGPSCIRDFDLSIIQHGFPLEWLTLNTVPDGAYYLRAKATDCSNNEDDNPRTIRVTVANELPTAIIENPATACTVICPDSPEDTIGYVHGTVDLYATTSSTIPVNKVEFYYKNIFLYPTYDSLIGTDYFPTDGKYSVQWNTGSRYGRYHLWARVYNAAGRYGDSEPIEIGVDNSGPFSQIISIDGNSYPNGMDITKGDVIDIELVAIDSTSDEGWTRCYNSGLTSIQVCIENCETGQEITKCFEVTPATDGFHTVQWNTSGLEFDSCSGCYYLYVKATDCLGNTDTSTRITVYVSDITAPITTIGGFDGNYVYGYSSEKVQTLLFEYAEWTESGVTNWIPIGWSDTLPICSWQNGPGGCGSCAYYLYKTSWDPTKLADGEYLIRVISHDICSNQNDSLAPVAGFTAYYGTIYPYSGPLGALSFEKNWCVGGMHGIVHETCSWGTPVVIARYTSSYECVEMQANLNYSYEYDGSFFAHDIESGGPAKFFSSVTLPWGEDMTAHWGGKKGQSAPPPYAYVTFLNQGSFDVVQVKRDLGTHGTYQNGCVEVTIPGGAVGGTFTFDRYIWVSPTTMPWVPVTQPDLKPIGDNNGYATYVAFTDCYYCCGWFKSQFGGEQGDISQSGAQGSGDCCFNPGRYAKIKMCYDSTVTTSKEHLAVMWWDCQTGKFCFDSIYYPPGVEGFNTTNHTVEFATTCLSGPFAVVELIEPSCNGSIVVNMRAEDIEPYSNGYTNTMPTFTSFINDRVQGTQAIDQSSIQFKLDLFSPGELVRIYTGKPSDFCDRWMTGFGSFYGSGYDPVPGIFKAGWNDPTYYNYYDGSIENCQGCYSYYCKPKYPLKAGDHIATVTAQNRNIQTCTDTVNFKVDATPPVVVFEEKCVGSNPEFNVYITDRESGVNKDSVWIYLSQGPTDLSPDQVALMWVNDTTIHVKVNLNMTSTTNLDVLVYEGTKNANLDPSWEDGPVDMVGNKATAFWHRYNVDLTKPTIALVKPSYRFRNPVLFSVKDPLPSCGIYLIKIDECTSPTGGCTPAPTESWSYDTQTEILSYIPPTGGTWIQVTVKDSAHNTTFLDSTYCVEDYDPPMVSFVPGYNGKYVGPNPTIKFVVTDGVAGVDWEKVSARISGCSNQCDYPWTEVLNRMQNDTVTLSCPLACSDGSNFTVYVGADQNFNKGPADKGENYIKSVQSWVYWVDASGPSITLKTPSDSLCNRPLLFEIKDTYSGFDTVYVYEDSSLVVASTVFTRDPHIPNYWTYTPTAGKTRLDLKAVDKLGNETWYGMKIKSDCTPPLASFGAEFVACYNPTVQITLTDDISGVDWSKVNVDLWKTSDRMQTFTPDLLAHEGNTITVTGDGAWLGLTDGSNLYVYVYSLKTPATSYSRGPVDIAGNYQTSTSWFSKTYTADCSGPSISWVWPSPTAVDSCSATLTFKISDSYSGVDSITVTEDGIRVLSSAYSYDRLTMILTYTPSAGKHKVVITAWDDLTNYSTYTFFRKDDCLPPGVKFVGEYVTKNPTVKIVVKDDKVGIDWNTVNVDLYQRDYPYKQCTFTAADIANFNMRHGDTVIVSCIMDLTDAQTLIAYVYAEKISGTGTSPSYGRGPADLSSNYMPKWQECIYQVDAGLPQLSPSCGSIDRSQRPIKICIIDGKSGVDWSSLEFYAESETLCLGSECQDTSVTVNITEGCIYYEPGAGSKHVEIRIKDQAGNQSICTFETEEENLFFTNPHNYPNPFDPRELSTYIDLGLSKSAHVTVKIYDFSGEFVRDLQRNEFTGISIPILWDGKTDDGTEVANGTYLCYIHARDDSGKIETAVIKITVLKKDK